MLKPIYNNIGVFGLLIYSTIISIFFKIIYSTIFKSSQFGQT